MALDTKQPKGYRKAWNGSPLDIPSPQHGEGHCLKVPHTRKGYLHGEDDDTPYDVDHVPYCGRCHRVIY